MIDLKFEDLVNWGYSDIVENINNNIEAHPNDISDKETINRLITDYPEMYKILSYLYSLVIEQYTPRSNDRWSLLKTSFEKFMSAIKFQYEALSRKVSINKEEEAFNPAWKK